VVEPLLTLLVLLLASLQVLVEVVIREPLRFSNAAHHWLSDLHFNSLSVGSRVAITTNCQRFLDRSALVESRHANVVNPLRFGARVLEQTGRHSVHVNVGKFSVQCRLSADSSTAAMLIRNSE